VIVAASRCARHSRPYREPHPGWYEQRDRL